MPARPRLEPYSREMVLSTLLCILSVFHYRHAMLRSVELPTLNSRRKEQYFDNAEMSYVMN